MNKLLILLTLLVLHTTVFSQEIDAIVDLITEGMTQDQVMNITPLKYSLENYLNSQQFSQNEWEGPKIPVNISIQLSAIGTNTYAGSLFIISKRTLSDDGSASTAIMFEDRGKWNFEYSPGLSFSYDYNRFDNVASIFDFYMLMIIGLDLDSYGELDGDQSYQRARRIFDIASSRNASGWSALSTDSYDRLAMINDLSTPRLDQFRKLIFEYYVDGLDLLASDRETAQQNIASTIHRMADFKERYFTPSYFIDSFFFTKCQEICEIFKGYKADARVFRDLMFLDVTNTVRYEAARDAK
ncbi:MAG: DUF4835 family protein [Ignavibacteria bacterium]|nr:DUF4835 family protein [Ignavibacteria bacterium]